MMRGSDLLSKMIWNPRIANEFQIAKRIMLNSSHLIFLNQITPHAIHFFIKNVSRVVSGFWVLSESALPRFSKLRFSKPHVRPPGVPVGIVCHANKRAETRRTNQQLARLNLD